MLYTVITHKLMCVNKNHVTYTIHPHKIYIGHCMKYDHGHFAGTSVSCPVSIF